MSYGKLDFYLKKFKELYGDKYTYKPELIVNSYDKFPIQCDCGNEFMMSASNHTRYGCRVCGRAASNKKRLARC